MKSNSDIITGNYYILKDNTWLENQRVAGKVVSKALTTLKEIVKEKHNYSTLELSKIAEDIIVKEKCTPTFKGYKGFPESCCISVNKQLVHGIPNNYKLQDGDVVSFDLGATFEGAIADSAITCIYGDPKKIEHVNLIENTKKSLNEAIKSIKVGKQLGCIGETIYKIGSNNNYGVVLNYGGHGIGPGPHEFPFVCNKDYSNNGIRFTPGVTIAIEPLFVLGGDSSTRVLDDGWTVLAKDICAHTEHTIFINEDNVEIITWREDDDLPQVINFN